MSLNKLPVSPRKLAFTAANHPDPHAHNLMSEMDWMGNCIEARRESVRKEERLEELPAPPELIGRDCKYSEYVLEQGLKSAERLILALAIVPYLAPDLLNRLQSHPQLAQKARLVRSTRQNGLLPSADTALFLLADGDPGKRVEMLELFSAEHHFYRMSVIETGPVGQGEPATLGPLSLNAYYAERFLHNRELLPRYDEQFPADLISTRLDWEDLVLAPSTSKKLEELKVYLRHHHKMVQDWGMAKHDSKGTKILFHGSSGTGKTLVATLLGTLTGQQVFRVDLSLVTSKYVGETSNRLRSLFNTAENKGWILFFDEGDAILGQRQQTNTEAPSSQYANQDVAYLLQRIESYAGTVVVASNFRANIDAAFTRRFDHIIKFENPDSAQLQHLWEINQPEKVSLAPQVDLATLLKRYQLSPAQLIRTLYRACLLSYANNQTVLQQEDLIRCFKDAEMLEKGMGRTLNR